MRLLANRTVGYVMARALIGGVTGLAVGFVLLGIDTVYGFLPLRALRSPIQLMEPSTLMAFASASLGAVLAVLTRRPRLAGWENVIRRISPLSGAGVGYLIGLDLSFVIAMFIRVEIANNPNLERDLQAFSNTTDVVILACVVVGAVLVTWRSWRAAAAPAGVLDARAGI